MRLVVVACTLALVVLCELPKARAAEPPAATDAPDPDPATLEARRHFKNGIKLYRDANYAGALTEFEAAYEKKPGPGSLQNVALCQKALFRYAEAADTLKLLLERHASELSEEEKTAARLAHDEIEALVGSVVVRVRPSHAKVTLDAKFLDPGALGASLRVNVGEHVVVADAPGFARVSKTVRVAAGAHDVPVELALEPVMGFLDVTASDPGAVIAIDGRPVGLGRWAGPVSSDDDHLVQVYRAGFEPFEERVTVERGQTKPVSGKLGPAIEGAAGGPPPEQGSLPPPPAAKPQLGWYSIATLNLLGTGATPFDFDISNDESSGGAVSVGIRVGRRLWTTLGAEMMLEAGSLKVDGACDKDLTENRAGVDCGSSAQISRHYSLGWVRSGPLVRLETPGERLRAGAAFGAGLVWHELRLARHAATPATDDRDATLALSGGKARGVDLFFLLELGAAYHFGHLFVGLDLTATLDGARGLDGNFDGHELHAFDQAGRTVPMVGIGLRAGYSQWAVEKKPR